MEKLTLQSIRTAVGGSGGYDCPIENICIDTRKLTKNCLYIAIKGENFDGHNFIEDAFKLGASAVMSEKPINHEKAILVTDTKIALLELAKYYRSLFSVFTVGVTGSVGKTSTKEMIYTILNAKGKTLKTQGNLNNEIGMPLTIFGLENDCQNAVFEMGMSDFGEIETLSSICKPSVGIITNIGFSHIETLKTQENILKAKLEILKGMGSDAPLVLNGDDDLLKTVRSKIDHPIIYYGFDQTADITATNIKQDAMKTSFTVNFYGKTIEAEIPTVGKHNVKNALAGFCIGLLAEIPPEQIVGAMKWYKNSGMRQNISYLDGVTIIEDCYNASPDSMAAAIDVVKSVECTGNRVCVLGDMLELGEKSEELHLEVGKMVARANVDMLLCYGEQAKNIKRGAIIIGMKNVMHFEDKESLASYIKANITRGDVIIYKASRGMRLEEVIKLANK